MSFRYRITLYPELLSTRENVNLNEGKADVKAVQAAVEEFNRVSSKARVKKSIDPASLRVNRDSLEFVLSSSVFLKQPTKGARLFINLLLKMPKYDGLVRNGRLFKGECELLEEEPSADERRILTDEEALIEVTRLFFRETAQNRATIETIKELLTT